jgi:aspartate aminotransferase-like enzyme
VDRYEVPWGEVHSLDQLDSYLSSEDYRAITVTHSETSTGALNDVRAISGAAHAREVLCMIDSVSGAGGAELRFDEWQLDYVLTGSQKAFALPPGLAFAAASDQMVALARTATERGVYFDIVEMEEFARRNQVPATPAFSLLYALEVQLGAILAETVERRWERHHEMLALTSSWLIESARRTGTRWENIVSDEAARSPTVSTIRVPDQIPARDFVARVKSLGIQVASGYGKLSGTTFRIGHMGDHTPATLKRCFAACEKAVAG